MARPAATLPAPGLDRPVPDSLLVSEETTDAAGLPPVIEESAILFANGQTQQALGALTHAVAEDDLGSAAQQVWLMLFDLYQQLEMKDEFESLGFEFAVKFERSPPAWVDAGPGAGRAIRTGGIGYFGLSGMLTQSSNPQFEKLQECAQSGQMLRIDFSKLESIDAAGCTGLLDSLSLLRASGVEILLSGENGLLRLLEGSCQTGNRSTDGAFWSLLFEVLRLLGQQERFEDAAVNYAVTYEVSPPSWETEPDAKLAHDKVQTAIEPQDNALRLSGELLGANAGLAMKIQEWAASHSPVVLDLSEVKRVDFVSAGLLLNVCAKLHRAGHTMEIRNANELVVALFNVMGIQRLAKIIHHK